MSASHHCVLPARAPGFLHVLRVSETLFLFFYKCVPEAGDSEKGEEETTEKRRTGRPRRGELLSGELVDESGGERKRTKSANACAKMREKKGKARNQPHTDDQSGRTTSLC